MESRGHFSVTGSSTKTLDDLPYDVTRELFSYVSTKELISVWRLVSTKWNHLASDLCRQRSVSLRLPHHYEFFNAPPIGHLFSDADNLPFSSAILSLDSDSPEGHAFSNYAVSRFGDHFKSARITTRLRLCLYRSLFDTLRRTPNLVTLEILPELEWRENTADVSGYTFGEIKLPELKTLKMTYADGGEFMDILELCFRQLPPNWDSIDLRLNPGIISDAEFNRCIELISSRNFRKLSLNLPLEFKYSAAWRTLVARGPIEIQTLEISCYDEEVELLMTFDLLVRFLSNCQGLTSLSLEGFKKRSLTSKRFRLPTMSTVTKLKLDAYFTEQDLVSLPFEPFKSQQFPSLTEVVVHFDDEDDGPDRDVVDMRQIFDVSDDDEKFLGVTSLDVGSTFSTRNWADVFPNLRKLTASLRDAGQLATIVTKMTQVAELDLHLKGIFFGLPQHMRSLKQLKTLTLRVNKLGDEILPPLNLKLVYYKYELSDDCLSLLRNRHLFVEVMKEDDKF